MLCTALYSSPIGEIIITASEKGIVSLEFEKINSPLLWRGVRGEANQHTDNCLQQLHEYFSGNRKQFELQFDFQGTEFQKRVWSELLKVPYGKTVSYAYIAKATGDSKAVRAVGNANGKNKIAIIVPCHRVIGSDGSLTGYAGGMSRKKWLLDFEQKAVVPELFDYEELISYG